MKNRFKYVLLLTTLITFTACSETLPEDNSVATEDNSAVAQLNIIEEEAASEQVSSELMPQLQMPGDFNITQGFYSQHTGMDFSANGEKEPAIKAVYPGKVTSVGFDEKLGNFVITEKDEVEILYAHFDSVNLKEGDTVDVAENIGTMGETGITYGNGPVLHLEMKLNGTPVNPADYM